MTDLQTIALTFIDDAQAVINKAIKEDDFSSVAKMIHRTPEEVGEMKVYRVWNRLAVEMAADFLLACEEEERNQRSG